MEDMIISQAVILAGGLGTRLRPFTDENPKPMYPFQGRPFIEYLMRQIKNFGIHNVLLLLGYLPEKIMDYLGDGSRYGITISYDVAPVSYNTADRLLHAQDQIMDTFLLMYCDNYCPIDFLRLKREFAGNKALIQLSVYENRDGYTKDNLLVQDGLVTIYDKKRVTSGLRGVDIGYAIIDKCVLQYITESGMNFEAVVYPEVIRQKKLYATVTAHRYYSVGSWERIKLTEQFFRQQPTVLLDRDGTINKRAPKACYIETPEAFVWLEGAREGIRLLKDAGYRVIIVSNQPGIARGNLTEDVLAQIHKKMQEDLKQETGYEIDAIYYCPHNWDEGCECRKPAPGMLYQAQRDFSLNLTECFMIGDDERDMEAGKAAGCQCVLVSDSYCLLDAVYDLLEGKYFGGNGTDISED